MQEVIPENVLDIYKTLEKEGFEVYFVGGSVRNMLLKRAIKDWDLTTNATPDKLTQIFKNGFYDNDFGTVGIPVVIGGENKVVEITTYRTEQGYKDKRHPEKVSWGKTIEEDLERRDFTINAIALKLLQGKLTTYELIDPYNGEKDLSKKTIKAVGDANLRFKEDALRLIRAVRIATELEFKIEKQ